MNQILYTNNDKNNYNKVDTKKIIKFFSIAIILVALVILGIKAYEIYEKKKNMVTAIMPEISITRADETAREVTIKATCEEGIEYLIYTWNNEQEVRVNLNGSTTFERIVEIPGNKMNNLNVQVTAMNGKANQTTEIFENNVDNIKPIVNSISIINKKLNLEVTDNKGIKYIAYKWENEEEVIIEADENNNEKMTAEIDIQRGTYKLQIRIVDIYGNEETLSRLITGANEPEVSVIKYGDTVNISVTHDMGFKKIEFIINGTKYVYDENFSKYDKNKTEVEYTFPLEAGENIVQVNAYSMEKFSEEAGDELESYSYKKFSGKCTYEP